MGYGKAGNAPKSMASKHAVRVLRCRRVGYFLQHVPMLADIAVIDPEDVNYGVARRVRLVFEVEMDRDEVGVSPDHPLHFMTEVRQARAARLHHRQRRVAARGGV